MMITPRRLLFVAFAAAVSLGAASAAHAAEQYKLDLAHSSFVFRITHLEMSYVYGRFNQAQADISLDRENPANSSFNVTIDAASIDTGNQQRDEHLRNPDFFNVKQFPEITFNSTAVEKTDDGYRVTGDLAMHGKTQSLTIDLALLGEGEDPWGNHRAGFATDFTIQRSDFGMTYGIDNGVVGDDVEMMISFEAVRQ